MKNLNQVTVTGGRSLVMTFSIMAMKPHSEAVKTAYMTPFLLSEPIRKNAKERNYPTGTRFFPKGMCVVARIQA
jgi:hypothetical protein